MKKTFLKSFVVAAVTTAAVALSSIAAFAATTIYDFAYAYSSQASNSKVNSGTVLFDDIKLTLGGKNCDVIKSATGYEGDTPYADGSKLTARLRPTGAGGTYALEVPANAVIDFYVTASDKSDNNYSIDYTLTGPAGTDPIVASGIETKGDSPKKVSFKVETAGTYTLSASAQRCTFYAVAVTDGSIGFVAPFEKESIDKDLDQTTDVAMDANIRDLTQDDTACTEEKPYDDTTMSGFTVYGSVGTNAETGAVEAKGMTIEAKSKTISGVTYPNRLKTNGTGNKGKNSIHFSVDKDSTVEALCISSSSTATRPLVLATKGGTELASEMVDGATPKTVTFSVTAGDYCLYSGNGGINFYSLKVLNGVSYKLPMVTLETTATTDKSVSYKVTIDKDFTAGEVTGVELLLAHPTDATATAKALKNYTTDEAGNYVLNATVKTSDVNLKAQAKVTFAPVVAGVSNVRYSGTEINTVE